VPARSNESRGCNLFIYFRKFGLHFLNESKFVHISSALCSSDTVQSFTCGVTPKWVRPILMLVPTHDISMNWSEIRACDVKFCSLQTTALFLILYWF